MPGKTAITDPLNVRSTTTDRELQRLRWRHQSLDELIRLEMRRPLPDDQELRRLKLEKLRVKEALTRAEGPTLDP